MSDQSLDNVGVTDSPSTASQAQATKTYTQEEFDNHMAGLKSSLTKKFTKQFEELGDIDELRSLKQMAESKKLEEATKRGEFEKVLQDLAAKKDAEISKRDSIIKEYKINTPLISAAAKYNAVNAEQVKALLNANIRLGDSGEVEVVDSKGSVRYSDKGEPIGVDDLVREFLDTNPHFKLANPATTATKSNISGPVSGKKVDISKLDMTNPEHRAAYKEYRKSNGLV
jgi:hypothetical protein